MGDDSQLEDELEQEILAYLDANPEAADSLDGVLHSWILQQRFYRGLRALEPVLDRLVASGEVERVLGPDGRPLFRAGPARRPGGHGPV